MAGRNKPDTRSSAVYPHDAARYHTDDRQNRPFPSSALDYMAILVIVAVACFVVLFFTLMIMSDLYKPRLPHLRVDSFSVSNFTSIDGSRMSFVAEIRLTAQNPSGKVSISYDQHMVAAIYYKFMLLSQATLAPFSQKPENKTSLMVKLAADGNDVEKWVMDAINGDIGQNGRVQFDFELASWVNWDSSTRDFVKAFCGNLTVAIPSDQRPGGLIHPPGHCRVGRGPDDELVFK
ncbi:uncharacterized protein [Henckelia pumila]|uniref:uncharacterized protein n=1 Tax=Henckelia pumila TaxID=405737 RepID=UPI003C6E26D4